MALHLALLLLLTSQPAFGTTRALGHNDSFDMEVEEMGGYFLRINCIAASKLAFSSS